MAGFILFCLMYFELTGRRAKEQGDVQDHGRRARGSAPGHVARARQALRPPRVPLSPSGKDRSVERCQRAVMRNEATNHAEERY